MHIRPLLRNDEKAVTKKNENQIDNCKPVNSWYKDFNWLAVLTESVYKLELHAATASVRRCAVALQRWQGDNMRVAGL